ncbi:MAG TPA: DUF5302 domain-containing protein [Jatrophihabitans sp.]|jgi:hypothetical protein
MTEKPEESVAKDQFKEALEKKRAQQHKSAAGSGSDSKIHSTHGAAGGKREFRRKSGG